MKQYLTSEHLSAVNIPKLSKIWVNVSCLTLQNPKGIANLEIIKTEEESLVGAIVPYKDKLPGYRLYVDQYGNLSCLQILSLFPEIASKLGIEFQYLISTLSQSIKITIAKLLKMYPKEEQNNVLEIIYCSAKEDGIPEELIYFIREATITPSLGSKNLISRINSRKNAILESLNIKHELFDILGIEFKHLLEKSLYMRGEQLIYDYLKIFSVSDRARMISKYENNPEFIVKYDNNGIVRIFRNKHFIKEGKINDFPKQYYEKSIATIKSITEEQLMSKTKLIKNHFKINHWKKLLQKSKSQEEKVIILHDAIESLNKIIYQFPWTNVTNDGQNPVDIVKTKEMQCIGKAMIAHIFLDKLGIKHKGCYQLSHVSLIVYIDGRQYLFDTNGDEYESCLEMTGIERDGKMFVCHSIAGGDSGKSFRYQLLDAEQMCFGAIASNLIQDNPVVFEQINSFQTLLAYFNNRPCISHNLNLAHAYMQFGDIDAAIIYSKKELEIDKESHLTYANLGECYYLKKQYLESYLSFLDAIYYGFDINSFLNYKEHLEELRTSQYFTSRKPLSTEQNEFMDSFLTNKNRKFGNQNSKENYLKVLSIDSTNPSIWYLIFQNTTGKQKVIANLMNEYLSNYKIIFDSESFKYYHIETKDLFYQFIKLYHIGDYDGMFELFCSLEDKK